MFDSFRVLRIFHTDDYAQNWNKRLLTCPTLDDTQNYDCNDKYPQISFQSKFMKRLLTCSHPFSHPP